jgi:hypothetical protein
MGEKSISFMSVLPLEIPRLAPATQLGESLTKAYPAQTDLCEGLKAQEAALLQKRLKPHRPGAFATHRYFGKDLPGARDPVLILNLPDSLRLRDRAAF